MYKNDRRRAAILWGGGTIAVGICLALIIFFIYTLTLRTSYRAFCMEINDAILKTEISDCSIGRGGENFPADETLVNYYDEFLLDDGTLVYTRKKTEPTERSIILTIGENTLYFTPIDSGTAVCLQWSAPDKTSAYSVRAGHISFQQLVSYYTNYKNKWSQ